MLLSSKFLLRCKNKTGIKESKQAIIPFIRTFSHDDFTSCSYGLSALQAARGGVTWAATHPLRRAWPHRADAQRDCESSAETGPPSEGRLSFKF
jgi:hypothetical protein